MYGGMGDVGPGEGLDIGWGFADCDVIGPHDAAETDDEAQKRKSASLETVVSLLSAVKVCAELLALHVSQFLYLHNRLIIYL